MAGQRESVMESMTLSIQMFYQRLFSTHSLEVDVCTHEGIVEEEDLALLGFEHLALFTVDRLDERLAQNELPLVSVQLLQERERAPTQGRK